MKKGWHQKKLNPVSTQPDEALYSGPHLLDSEVEPFCRRVSEFGKIVQGLVSFRETDQKEAIRRADVFLHGGAGDGSFDGAPAKQPNQNKTTECGDGPAPKVKVGTESSESEKTHEKSAANLIQKTEVLLEDCSDDDDVCQTKATTSTNKSKKRVNFKEKSAKPTSNAQTSEENTNESMQSAEQGILDMLNLPSKEELRSKKLDAIARKEKSDRYRKKGNIAFRDKAFADAVLNYTKAIELIPEDSYMYMNRAQAYFRVGLPGMALEDLTKAVEMNPKSLKAHLLQARAYFNLSLPNKTKEFLERVKKDFHSKLGMIQAFEKDLFDLKMEKRLETSEEVRQREEIRKLNRIPMLTDLEEKWKKLGRHQLLEEESVSSNPGKS